jgi:hypothetical protein
VEGALEIRANDWLGAYLLQFGLDRIRWNSLSFRYEGELLLIGDGFHVSSMRFEKGYALTPVVPGDEW